MENGIRVFAVINLAIMGLSHVVAHRAWGDFFERLVALGRPGAFAHGFLTVFFGSLVVGLHNVWSGPSIVLTVVGWMYIVKATMVFLNPDWAVRSMSRVTPETSRILIVPGLIMLAVAAVVLFDVLRTSGVIGNVQ